MRPVVVFDGAQPSIRLLSWFLREAGAVIERCADEQGVLYALAKHPVGLVVVNTIDPPPSIRHLINSVRDCAPAARVVLLLTRPHEPVDEARAGDICVHGVVNVETAVDEILRLLADAAPA